MIEKLIVGGSHSGKRARVEQLGFSAQDIADGGACNLDKAFERPVLYGLHLLVRRLMQQEQDPAAIIAQGLQEGVVRIVVCDEIGCGVVPMDRLERDWREQTGRILCQIAQQAPSVERVFCGIATEMKKK